MNQGVNAKLDAVLKRSSKAGASAAIRKLKEEQKAKGQALEKKG